MAGKLDFDAGQAAMGHKLTISEVLAEYLRMERGRLAPKTHARYTEVIVLFTQSLNGYAANSLSQFERARFDKLFNAEGEQHREFCDIFGPEHILENVGEFLNYLLISEPPRVASRLSFDCRPKGLLFGLHVNGKRVSFTENVFYEFRDERIEKVWSVIDKAAIESQF